jgi:protein-disulfide isomerase
MMSIVRSAAKLAAIVLAGLGIGLILSSPTVSRLWRPAQPAKFAEVRPPADPISIENSPYEGSPDARVIIIEYSDFECPVCRRFATDVLPTIRKRYVETGTAAVVFKHFALERIHPLAIAAGAAADCASAQGQFWPAHDFLLSHPLSRELIDQVSDLPKLDRTAMSRCVGDTVSATKIQVETSVARGIGITGTPTFLVGRRQDRSMVDVVVQFSGARKPAYFDEVIRQVGR